MMEQLNINHLERDLSRVAETAMAVITAYGLKVIGAIVILVVGWILAGMVQRWILRAGKRTHRLDTTVITFTASTFKYVVMTFTLIAVLSSFGVETTSFVAVLGAIGLAVGLALQGTLGHVASGLMLIIFRPFRVGDYIEAGGVAGTVQSISLFVTEVDTFDNIHIVIPNGLIWGATMKNYHENRTRRFDLTVGISYDDDINQAMKVARAVVDADARILREPEPTIAVSSLGESAVNILVRVWIDRDNFFPAQYDLNKNIKEAFDAAEITIPFPQRVIRHVHVNGPPPPAVLD